MDLGHFPWILMYACRKLLSMCVCACVRARLPALESFVGPFPGVAAALFAAWRELRARLDVVLLQCSLEHGPARGHSSTRAQSVKRM